MEEARLKGSWDCHGEPKRMDRIGGLGKMISRNEQPARELGQVRML